MSSLRSLGTLVVGFVAFGSAATLASKVETWRHDTATSFNKGKKERVVVADNGDVTLGRPVSPVGSLNTARVWDIARDAKGAVFAATGDEGKVFKLVRDQWETAFDASDSQALSLVATPDGHMFLGTGPSGLVIDLSDPKKAASKPAAGVQYIWDLATDKAGNIYAATGPTGQLWKRDTKGAWTLLLDSKYPHILCVAVRADGSVFAGSDGEGLIYRVSPEGKVSVVYDAPQSEIRSLIVGPEGSVYAGTAVESGGGSGSGRPSAIFGGSTTSFGGGGATALEASTNSRAQVPQTKESRVADRPSPTGGTAAPKPPSPGENAVYRIGVDGVARELFRGKYLIHALALQGDRLLVGTGPDGLLFELRDAGRSTAQVARLDSGQVLALSVDRDGEVLIGTGDPGTVVRLGGGHVPAGTLTSDVLDAKLISRFGSLGWKADVPRGSSLSVQLRSGQVGEPDETWSSWSAEQPLSDAAHPSVPPGRFAQYRVIFRTDDPSKSPELHSIALRYQTENLAPEINKLDVPDITAGDGASKLAKVAIKWDATDPNGDDMEYRVFVKKEGWPSWVALGENAITESKYEWDSTSVPGGLYRVKLTASDRLSNRPEETLVRDRESEPFLIDHLAPKVTLDRRGEASTISINLLDDATRLTKAAYALDGGDWRPIFPDDSLFDATRETITLKLIDLKPGMHVLMVRATDAAGNLGTADLVFEVR